MIWWWTGWQYLRPLLNTPRADTHALELTKSKSRALEEEMGGVGGGRNTFLYSSFFLSQLVCCFERNKTMGNMAAHFPLYTVIDYRQMKCFPLDIWARPIVFPSRSRPFFFCLSILSFARRRMDQTIWAVSQRAINRFSFNSSRERKNYTYADRMRLLSRCQGTPST